jgi:gluconolactonase
MRAFCAAMLLALGSLAAQPVFEAEPATVVAFTEGPTVDAEGNVYFTETVGNRIMRLSTGGALTTVRENTNTANGMVFDSQWRLVACEGGKRQSPRVTRMNVKTGTIEVLAERFEGKPLNGPNDVTFDGKGRLYFTDPGPIGQGAVYRIDTDWKLARILSGKEIEKPNGIVISPDDRTLYLIESNQAERGARMIRAYDLQQDGSVTHMRVFHNFYPGRSADGMTIDTRGNIYAAAGLHRRRGTSETLDTRCGVYVFAPDGKLLHFVPIPEDTVTNCAFGGPDMKTLYVTAGKTLFRIRTEVAGTRR